MWLEVCFFQDHRFDPYRQDIIAAIPARSICDTQWHRGIADTAAAFPQSRVFDLKSSITLPTDRQ
jgi:hypothetical protein